MRIDGKAIAEITLTDLTRQVTNLKKKGVTPTLAVIQVGDDPASTAYINQKQKAAERIGAMLIHEKLPLDVSYQRVTILVHEYNTTPDIHGIIIQQPLPDTLGDISTLLKRINPQKDVDGFLPNSPYPVPVAAAVITIMKGVTGSCPVIKRWLRQKSIVVIGRGETAGKPIADTLIKHGCTVSVIHSQTKNPDVIIKSADIVISCVGKPNIVRRDNIRKDAILLSIGIWRDDNGKLHGDYDEDAIQHIASAYTPTPGGVGPVNVACLMQNLLQAVSKAL